VRAPPAQLGSGALFGHLVPEGPKPDPLPPYQFVQLPYKTKPGSGMFDDWPTPEPGAYASLFGTKPAQLGSGEDVHLTDGGALNYSFNFKSPPSSDYTGNIFENYVPPTAAEEAREAEERRQMWRDKFPSLNMFPKRPH